MSVCITCSRLCSDHIVFSAVLKITCHSCKNKTMVIDKNPIHCTKCNSQLPELIGFMPKSASSRVFYHVSEY